MARANTETLKNQMKANQQQPAQPGPQSPAAATSNSIAQYLKDMGPAIRNVLPKHMTPERMARIALSEIRKNPQLLQCEVASLGAAVMQAATLGLEPSVLGHCYFVPFNRKVKQGNRTVWTKDVQFIIGYKGYIDLARRSGDVLSINAMEVRENDDFEYEYGLNETLRHRPAMSNRGAVTHYYAYAKFKDGGHTFLVLSREDIVEHAYKFSKQQREGQLTGPWKDNFDSMAKKTVIRNMVKYMPLSIEMQEKLNSDEQIVKGINTDEAAADILDMEAVPLEADTSDMPADQPAIEEKKDEIAPEDLAEIEKDLEAAKAAQEKINQKKQQESK